MKVFFLRWSMLQNFSTEIMKLFIENKLDQNMQHVTLSSIHRAIELYKLLVFEKLACISQIFIRMRQCK